MKLKWEKGKYGFEAKVTETITVNVETQQGRFYPCIFGPNFIVELYDEETAYSYCETKAGAYKWCRDMLKALGHG